MWPIQFPSYNQLTIRKTPPLHDRNPYHLSRFGHPFRFRSHPFRPRCRLCRHRLGVGRRADARRSPFRLSNPIVIMMVGLFVVGGGIFSTGLAKMMGSRILSLAGTSETRLFVLLMLTTGGVGAFVSNTGTVALMLPIVVSMARAAGLQSSRFLMPLAFAGSMGGMLTLIGTPPNLVIRDALIHAGYGENVLSFSPSPLWASSASSLAYSCYFPFAPFPLEGHWRKCQGKRENLAAVGRRISA